MFTRIRKILNPNQPAAPVPHLASGMPTHEQLNAVSPGMHAPKVETPIAVPEQTYKPEVLGDTLEHKYGNLQRMLRNNKQL